MSIFSIDTKRVPVALHLMSQGCFSDVMNNDVQIHRKLDFMDFDENRPNFKVLPKILGMLDFDGGFG